MTDQRERVAGFAEELRDGPEPSDRSIKEIVTVLQPQVQELVNKQVELAKSELAPVGKQAGGRGGAARHWRGLLAVIFGLFLSERNVHNGGGWFSVMGARRGSQPLYCF